MSANSKIKYFNYATITATDTLQSELIANINFHREGSEEKYWMAPQSALTRFVVIKLMSKLQSVLSTSSMSHPESTLHAKSIAEVEKRQI